GNEFICRDHIPRHLLEVAITEFTFDITQFGYAYIEQDRHNSFALDVVFVYTIHVPEKFVTI
ncbi:MAG: hypothetical protein Q8M92_00650, partial [Candidatus Subteraquimicrobiales bacterium]|nr:hypothetical protein [Candidatus Subteraquimicrobiales bacterium]